jgi:hypothetical protein
MMPEGLLRPGCRGRSRCPGRASSKRSSPRSHSVCVTTGPTAWELAALVFQVVAGLGGGDLHLDQQGPCHGATPPRRLKTGVSEDAPSHSNAICPVSLWSGAWSAQSMIHYLQRNFESDGQLSLPRRQPVSSSLAIARYLWSWLRPAREWHDQLRTRSASKPTDLAVYLDAIPGASSQVTYHPLLSI